MTLAEVVARMLRTKTNAVFAPPGASYEMAAALLATPEGKALAALVEAAVAAQPYMNEWDELIDAVDAYLALEKP